MKKLLLMLLCFIIMITAVVSLNACNQGGDGPGDDIGNNDDRGDDTDVEKPGDDSGSEDSEQDPNPHIHGYFCKVVADEFLAKAASCVSVAEYYYSCSCGAHSETARFEYGLLLSHLKGEWEIEKYSTCATDGSRIRVCENCDKVVDREVIYATRNHNFVDGVCSSCHGVLSSDGLVFELNSDKKSYTLTGVSPDFNERIIFVDLYQGLPVTDIRDSAFAANNIIEEVYLGDNVETVGIKAFASCKNLAKFVSGKNLTCIRGEAFSGCSSLRNFILCENIRVIENGAFDSCTVLELIEAGGAYYLGSVANGSGVRTPFVLIKGIDKTAVSVNIAPTTRIIYEGAFEEFSRLANITIPSFVASIGRHAFFGCESLENIHFNAVNMNDAAASDDIFAIGSGVYRPVNVTVGRDVERIPAYIFESAGISSLTFDSGSLCESVGKYAFYKSLISSLMLPYSVKEIESYAFYMTNIVSLSLPGTLEKISDSAFYGCTALESVELPSSLVSIGDRAFFGCEKIGSLTLPSSLVSIGDHAFSGCTSVSVLEISRGVEKIGDFAFFGLAITELYIPNSVNSIGIGAFSGCSLLTKIEVNNSNSVYKSVDNTIIEIISSILVAGCNASVIPSDGIVKTIGAYAFYSLSGLDSVAINEGIEKIDEFAFGNCTSLKLVALGKDVKEINPRAFDGCRVLESFYIDVQNTTYSFIGNSVVDVNTKTLVTATVNSVIPSDGSVTAIGDYAFYARTDLVKFVIPDCVRRVGESAFAYCSSLLSIAVPERLSVGANAFYGCTKLVEVISSGDYTVGSSLNGFIAYYAKDVHEGESRVVMTDDGFIFYDFGGSVYLIAYDGTKTDIILPMGTPEGETYGIYDYAFSGNSDIKSVVLNSYVTSIGEGAFKNCSSITSIIVPNSVVKIGKGAFAGCSSMSEITLPFVGESISATMEKALFGYVFGNENYSGSILTSQKNSSVECEYYIPTSLKSIKITANSIPEGAFSGCLLVENITLSDELSFIGKNAFSDCQKLVYNIYEGICYIGSENNEYLLLVAPESEKISSVSIHSKTSIIAPYAFSYYDGGKLVGCKNITSISIPSSVKRIGECAFFGCESLSTLNLSSASMLEIIEKSAFEGCSSIRSVSVTRNVSVICERAFFGCKSMSSLTLSSATKLSLIEASAFEGCIKISSISIPASLEVISERAFFGCEAIGSLNLSSATNLTVIGESAFEGCIKISSITIPASLEVIEKRAFFGCQKLSTLGFAKNSVLESIAESAFENCIALTKLSVPESLAIIGERAFFGCTSLTEVVISSGVLQIGKRAFSDCSSITTVKFVNSSLKSVGSLAFSGCVKISSVEITDFALWCAVEFSDVYSNPMRYAENVIVEGEEIAEIVIPESVEAVKDYAFAGVKSITEVIIPSNVKTVGKQAFYECVGLKNLIIGAEYVDEYAFARCYNLSSVEISSDFKSASEGAFFECSSIDCIYVDSIEKWLGFDFDGEFATPMCYASTLCVDGSELQELVIPETIRVIPDYAFTGLGIQKVVLHKNIEYVGYRAFASCGDLVSIEVDKDNLYYCSVDGNLYSEDRSVLIQYAIGKNDKEFVVPSSVSKINDYAFAGATSLKSVTLGEGVSKIGAYAFFGCDHLTGFTLPSSLETIEDSVFENCIRLQYIVIGNDVKSIGTKAFKDCLHITSVVLPESLESIGNEAFFGCYKLVEVINKSTIEISLADSANGNVGSYAKYIHDGESKIENINGNLFLFVSEESKVYFLGTLASDNTSVVLPDDYKNETYSIYDYALTYRDDITDIVIGRGVSEFGEYAFANCVAVKYFALNATELSNISTDSCIFLNFGRESGGVKVIVGESVERIPDYIFAPSGDVWEAPHITSVEFAKNAKANIGKYAFYECKSMNSVTLGKYVTDIGDFAFYGCINISEILIPENVCNIGKSAFESCEKLQKVVINNDKLEYIGKDAFHHCINIEELHITDIGAWCITEFVDFYSNPIRYSNNLYIDDTLVSVIIVPETVTEITNYAFCDMYSLESLVITDNVKTIGTYAFSGCNSLSEITIGKGVTTINKYAFSNTVLLSKIYFNALSLKDLSSNNYVFENSGLNASIDVTVGADVKNIPSYLFCPYNSASAPSVKSVEFIGNNCTSIGNYAFRYCDKLEAISIPDSVKTIGSYAFSDCSSLAEIKIGKGVTKINNYAFADTVLLSKLYYNAASLSSLSSNNYVFKNSGKNAKALEVIIGADAKSIPNYLFCPNNASSAPSISSLKFSEGENITIGSYAFRYCSVLEKINLPERVTSVGSYAFADCTVASEVIIGNKVTSIGTNAFENCKGMLLLTIGTAVSKIDNNAFKNCDSLVNLVIPESVDTIGSSVFYSCDSLAGAIISDSVTSIGSSAFEGCKKLVDLRIGKSVKTIGSSAFKTCELLNTVIVPDSVTTLGTSAFEGCKNLSNVTLGNSLAKIDNSTFKNCVCLENITIPASAKAIGDSAFYGCSKLLSAVIPNSVATIGTSAFENCKGLVALEFGELLTSSGISVGNSAFKNCDSLESVVITNAVKSIGSSAFYSCDLLESVSIGNSLTSIGSSAFQDCKKLKNVTFGNSLVTIGDEAFKTCLVLDNIILPKTVSSIGKSAFEGCKALSSIVIPDPVKELKDYTFKGCESLQEVILSPYIRSVGSGVFEACENIIYNKNDNALYLGTAENKYFALVKVEDKKLESCIIHKNAVIILPESFKESNILSVSIPQNVEIIEDYAFNASKIKSVEIGRKVSLISKGAFYQCSDLALVVLLDCATEIGDSAFEDCQKLVSVDFGTSVTYIGNYAFKNCDSMKEIIMSDTTRAIGEEAFYNCDSLEYVKLGKMVTGVYNSAFEKCEKLSYIDFGGSIVNILANAFGGCESLKIAVIPKTLGYVGMFAFLGCEAMNLYYGGSEEEWEEFRSNIGSIEIGETNIQYAPRYYYSVEEPKLNKDKSGYNGNYWYYDTDGYVNIWDHEEFDTISNHHSTGLEYILSDNEEYYIVYGIGSFEGSELVIPAYYNGKPVREIVEFAFASNKSITKVVLSDNITTIGRYAFYNCSGVKELVLASSLRTVADSAFSGMNNLEKIEYLGTSEKFALISFGSGNETVKNSTKIQFNV